MLWTITLENIGPDEADVNLDHFYLLEGDQTGIINPIPQSQGLNATGGALEQIMSLSKSGQSTARSTTIVTFAFVPNATSYTLESEVHYCAASCNTVPFDPKLIPFIF